MAKRGVLLKNRPSRLGSEADGPRRGVSLSVLTVTIISLCICEECHSYAGDKISVCCTRTSYSSHVNLSSDHLGGYSLLA